MGSCPPTQATALGHKRPADASGGPFEHTSPAALTERWQDRHRRLTAALPGSETVLADVITHPEMLARTGR